MSIIVNTDKGKIEGIEKNGIKMFRGIPYAAPPVNSLRWHPTQEAEPWNGIRPAKEFSAVAPQNPSLLDSLFGREPAKNYSEDCLYLNVYTPATDNKKRPVMFWIHGGGFTMGAGSLPFYDCSGLSKNGDMVIVSINYRLGALGFMNLKDITGGKIDSIGNQGLQDQVAALGWVKKNIDRFGGDPEQVTIFGESAGGMSVGTLLAIPSAGGLFQKAILQSGACHAYTDREKSRLVTEVMLDLLEVEADPEALMALAVEDMLKVQEKLIKDIAVGKGLGTMPFRPVIDGTLLPEHPIEAIRKGASAGIPVLAGSNLDEWKLFGGFDKRVVDMTGETLNKQLDRRFPGFKHDELTGTYKNFLKNRGMETTPGEQFCAIETDRVFRIPALKLLEAQGEHIPDVYNYLFCWPSPMAKGILGSCHALELGFVFGTYNTKGADRFFGSGEEADRLHKKVQDAWMNFAKTGNPGNAGDWPVYDKENRNTMIFDAESRVEKKPFEPERMAWDRVPDSMIGSL